jgi:hypothetical protein
MIDDGDEGGWPKLATDDADLCVGLITGAPAGYPDLDPQVFWVTNPIPGPAKIFPCGYPDPWVFYLWVTGTHRYTHRSQIPTGIPVLTGIQTPVGHRYTCRSQIPTGIPAGK